MRFSLITNILSSQACFTMYYDAVTNIVDQKRKEMLYLKCEYYNN